MMVWITYRTDNMTCFNIGGQEDRINRLAVELSLPLLRRTSPEDLVMIRVLRQSMDTGWEIALKMMGEDHNTQQSHRAHLCTLRAMRPRKERVRMAGCSLALAPDSTAYTSRTFQLLLLHAAMVDG